MTPTEALDLIQQVVDKYLGTKKDHLLLAEAMETLRQATKAPDAG